MSRLAETRGALYGALTPLNANEPGYGVFRPWRTNLYPPNQVNAPCAWIDVPSVRVDDQGRGARFVVSSWSIFLAVDGGDPQQVQALDYMVARVWDALDALPMVDAQSITPVALDVGAPPGTSLRGAVVTVDVMHVVKTLCQPVMDTPAPAPVGAAT